ncbi:unnamed protein product [Meganyctiphanes norvegica]|uniref:Uncharacterized protein n=1 Tax=Meganyctiphanes norvegica TaxID=48144 RepID=A0AAV2R6Z8_MEGNR
MVSLQCVSSCGLQDQYSVRKYCHIYCIHMVSLYCVSFDFACENASLWKRIGCMDVAFLQCVYPDALLDHIYLSKPSHNVCIHISLHTYCHIRRLEFVSLYRVFSGVL